MGPDETVMPGPLHTVITTRGQWGSTPKVGAIVYYNLSGLGRVSHVGIVEKVFSDGSWYAIEGNTDERGGRTGGKVMRKHRYSVGVGGGFGYPKYGGKSSAPKSTPTYKPVKHGQMLQRYVKGAPVGDVQRFLRLKVDNAYGDATYKAVVKWQKSHKLEADGVVGPASWKAMKKAGLKSSQKKTPAKKKVSNPPAFPWPSSHWASQPMRSSKAHSGHYAKDRPGVKKIQARLKARGWNVSVDGYFGPASERVTRKFQAEKGLKVDGCVGLKTYTALWEEKVT